MKVLRTMTALAVALPLAAGLAFAQSKDKDDHSAHHPDPAKSAAPAKKSESVPPGAAMKAQMQSKIKAMQDQMAKIKSTTDPAERQKLMEEHMKSMQEGMSMMRGMMGGAGANKGGSGSMGMRMDTMEGRMDMMQQMMQQMMDRSQVSR